MIFEVIFKNVHEWNEVLASQMIPEITSDYELAKWMGRPW